MSAQNGSGVVLGDSGVDQLDAAAVLVGSVAAVAGPDQRGPGIEHHVGAVGQIGTVGGQIGVGGDLRGIHGEIVILGDAADDALLS